MPALKSHLESKEWLAGIKGSIRLESFRDGAEDYELLKILEARDPDLASSIVNSIVVSGSSYCIDINHMIDKRNELVRAAAGETLKERG